MLIRLFAPFQDGAGAAESFVVRKPIAPEYHVILSWIAERFSPAWSSEAGAALANRPCSLFVAVRGEHAELIGFCCYDATARGFVGPVGVAETARGAGVGAALLRACLNDMRAAGFGYAIVGAVGAPEFFRRVAGATEIPDSTPGIYSGMLKSEEKGER